MTELYDIRVTVERIEGRSVCGLAVGDYFEVTESRLLEEHVADYRTGEDARGREVHKEFHLGLYSISGSDWLMRVIPPLWQAGERYRRLSTLHRDSPESRWEEHHRILEACKDGDAQAAAAALHGHLTRSMELVRAELGELSGRESDHGNKQAPGRATI